MESIEPNKLDRQTPGQHIGNASNVDFSIVIDKPGDNGQQKKRKSETFVRDSSYSETEQQDDMETFIRDSESYEVPRVHEEEMADLISEKPATEVVSETYVQETRESMPYRSSVETQLEQSQREPEVLEDHEHNGDHNGFVFVRGTPSPQPQHFPVGGDNLGQNFSGSSENTYARVAMEGTNAVSSEESNVGNEPKGRGGAKRDLPSPKANNQGTAHYVWEGDFKSSAQTRRPYDYSESEQVMNHNPVSQSEKSLSKQNQITGANFPRRPDLDLSQKTRASGIESPMAEFDIDRRRTGSHGNVRGRRSRPLGELVRDLVMWRDARDSAVVFSFGLVLLLSLSFYSLISIFAYISMISLVIITSFVLVRQITLAFQQQSTEHPFRDLLDKDVVVNPDYAHQQLGNFLKPLNKTLAHVRNVYLADSLGQTLKYIFIMYLLTYVGSWFNLLTVLTMMWVGAFTGPKFYHIYKQHIDSMLDVVFEGLQDVKNQVTRAVNTQVKKLRAKGEKVSTSRSNVAGRIIPQGDKMGGDTFETEFPTLQNSSGGVSYTKETVIKKKNER